MHNGPNESLSAENGVPTLRTKSIVFKTIYIFIVKSLLSLSFQAHKAIAQFEEKYGADKSITVITQSVDGLHSKAGTKQLIELHGSLFKTRCIRCNDVQANVDSPICEVC